MKGEGKKKCLCTVNLLFEEQRFFEESIDRAVSIILRPKPQLETTIEHGEGAFYKKFELPSVSTCAHCNTRDFLQKDPRKRTRPYPWQTQSRRKEK